MQNEDKEKNEQEHGHPSHEERRHFKRFPERLEITMHSDTNFYVGFTRDISAGGLFIATYDHWNVGDRLEIEMAFEDKRVIKATVEVRWIKEYNPYQKDSTPGIGVKFVDISAEDRQYIENFLKKREPLFYLDEEEDF